MIAKIKFNYKIYLFLIVLILISFVISYSYYFTQYALNVVYLKEIIEYPDQNNPYYLSHVNSHSLIFYLISAMLKVGLSNELISRFIIFLATFFNTLGIFLICKSITKSNLLSFLIAMTLMVLQKNFGDIDYPTLMFSNHTNGMIAQSFCTLIFGLLTLKNIYIALFTSFIFLTVHPVMGLWMLVVVFFSFLYSKKFKKIDIKFNYSNQRILILTLIFFFIIYLLLKTNNIFYSNNSFEYNLYKNFIEAHRTNYGYIKLLNYNYIVKTFILSLIIISYIKYSKSFKINQYLALSSIVFSIVASFLIYITYKYLSVIYPEIIVRMIPQRFFLAHSVIGYAIIISILYQLLNNFLKKIKYNFAFYCFTILILLHLFQHHKAINTRLDLFFENSKNIQEEKKNWQGSKKLVNKNGLALTSNELCDKAILHLNLPILICFESLDFVSYFPNLAQPTRSLVENVLGIKYEDIKEKHLGGITNNDLKIVFENKSNKDWLILKNTLNVNYLIVPEEWQIDLKNYILVEKYKFYFIK